MICISSDYKSELRRRVQRLSLKKIEALNSPAFLKVLIYIPNTLVA
jgi:hypothetical protein